MPIPTIKCSICGNEVTKRKSTALPNGTRACETHPEAIAAAENARKKVIQNASHAEERRKNRWNDMFRSKPEIEKPLVAKCFCCNREGLHQTDFAYRVLIATEKMRTKGLSILPWKIENGKMEADPEYAKALRENMKSPEESGEHIYVCLYIVSIADNPKMNAHLSYNARMAADLTGAAMVCPACVDKHGVKKPELPKLTAEQVDNWAVIATLMEPQLQEVAQKEMAATYQPKSPALLQRRNICMLDFQQIIEYVVRKHANQKRKGVGGVSLPYAIHPIEVVKKAYMMDPLAFAGDGVYILHGLAGHDLFEDTDANHEDVREYFGIPAYNLIVNLTYDKVVHASKEAYIASFATKPMDAVFGKIMDRAINVHDFMIQDIQYAPKYFHKAQPVFDTWYGRQQEAVDTFGRKLVTNVNAEIAELARMAILLDPPKVVSDG